MYEIIFNNETIELPKYTFAISDELEKAEKINNGSSPFKEKCRVVYNAMNSFLDVEKIIGKFDNEINPNDIQILYSRICAAYNKPVLEERMSQFEDSLENKSLDKIQGFADSLQKVEGLSK